MTETISARGFDIHPAFGGVVASNAPEQGAGFGGIAFGASSPLFAEGIRGSSSKDTFGVTSDAGHETQNIGEVSPILQPAFDLLPACGLQ